MPHQCSRVYSNPFVVIDAEATMQGERAHMGMQVTVFPMTETHLRYGRVAHMVGISRPTNGIRLEPSRYGPMTPRIQTCA